MNPIREELIEGIGMASTKSELLTACAQLQKHYPTARTDANPELLEMVATLIATQSTAVPGAAFPLPLSMRLIALMYKEVGPNTYVLIDSEAWSKLVSDPDATVSIDPCCRTSDVLAGHVGVLYGVGIYTDAYYDEKMRSLPKNTLTVMSIDGTRGLSVVLA